MRRHRPQVHAPGDAKRLDRHRPARRRRPAWQGRRTFSGLLDIEHERPRPRRKPKIARHGEEGRRQARAGKARARQAQEQLPGAAERAEAAACGTARMDARNHATVPMRPAPVLAALGLLWASDGHARCYSIWHYAQPQRCHSAQWRAPAREATALAPAPVAPLDEDALRAQAIERLKLILGEIQ